MPSADNVDLHLNIQDDLPVHSHLVGLGQTAVGLAIILHRLQWHDKCSCEH